MYQVRIVEEVVQPALDLAVRADLAVLRHSRRGLSLKNRRPVSILDPVTRAVA